MKRSACLINLIRAFGNEITNLNRYKWKRLKAKEMSETKVRKEE